MTTNFNYSDNCHHDNLHCNTNTTMTIESTQTVAVDRFKCLWTPHKHQVRKRWNDGILHFHTFNFRAMLYDEANVLVDDLFIPKQRVSPGDQLEFDYHLVSVEDTLNTIYSDISSLYTRRQKYCIEKNGSSSPKPVQKLIQKQSKRSIQKQLPKQILSVSSTNSINVPIDTFSANLSLPNLRTFSKKTKFQKSSIPSIKEKKDDKVNLVKHDGINAEDIHDIIISDAEAYDLFSQQ